MRLFAAFFALIVMSTAAFAGIPSEKAKIDYLLDQLATSDVTFIRNGEEHDGAWAKDHLAQKLKESSNPNMTAEEFIVNIATKSSHTDKPYLIKLKDGNTLEAAKWFHLKLAEMPEK